MCLPHRVTGRATRAVSAGAHAARHKVRRYSNLVLRALVRIQSLDITCGSADLSLLELGEFPGQQFLPLTSEGEGEMRAIVQWM